MMPTATISPWLLHKIREQGGVMHVTLRMTILG